MIPCAAKRSSTATDCSTLREPSSTPGRRWQWRSITQTTALRREQPLGERAQRLGRGLGLRQQGEGDQRVGGQQVERDRPVARDAPRRSRAPAPPRAQDARRSSRPSLTAAACSSTRVPERRGPLGRALRSHATVPGRSVTSALMPTARPRSAPARPPAPRPSLAGSPAPAEAKPGPAAALAAAHRRDPVDQVASLLPRLTRSSVTATCTAPVPPPRQHQHRLAACRSRNRSASGADLVAVLGVGVADGDRHAARSRGSRPRAAGARRRA